MRYRFFAIFILLTLFLPHHSPAFAEEGTIELAFLQYGFMEAIEFCKYKHHGSYTEIAGSYEQWQRENESEIRAAFKQLEKEAAANPVKAKKLVSLESTIRASFLKEFLEMPAEQSAPMCFTENGFLERFDSKRLSKY